jgi:hypothetical protein
VDRLARNGVCRDERRQHDADRRGYKRDEQPSAHFFVFAPTGFASKCLLFVFFLRRTRKKKDALAGDKARVAFAFRALNTTAPGVKCTRTLCFPRAKINA